jgi:hypothetical protein
VVLENKTADHDDDGGDGSINSLKQHQQQPTKLCSRTFASNKMMVMMVMMI